jgi:glycosyltransferase involved in cell wall biosynthesis
MTLVADPSPSRRPDGVELGTEDTSAASAVRADVTFSVVIPAYNRADTIAEAISSVLKQTYPVKEIIVVDDGSTDGTVEKISGIGSSIVRTLVNETNLGAPASRNRGAAAATGEWIAFLDSDDYWHPGKIEAERALIARNGSGASAVASNHVLVIDGRISPYATEKEKVPDVASMLRTANFLGTCSCMTIRRDQFLAVGGFDETLRSCQDWDLWLRIAGAGAVLISPPGYVYYRLNTQDCISTDGRKRQAGHVHIWKSHIRSGQAFHGDRAALAVIFADLCQNRRKMRSFRRLCRYVLRAQPRRLPYVAAMMWNGTLASDYLSYRRRMEQAHEAFQSARRLLGRRS